eukprot:ctg_3881.g728
MDSNAEKQIAKMPAALPARLARRPTAFSRALARNLNAEAARAPAASE